MRSSICIIAIACLCYSLKLRAQTYRAGDITYTWTSGYTYDIKFTTYTNNNGGIDNRCEIDTVCFGDNTGARLIRTNGPSVFCSAPAKDGVVLNPSVKLNEYVISHTYPGPGNYQFCFDQPNRNAGINNIPNSINQPMSLKSYMVISPFLGPNSSPVFGNYAVAYICLNGSCYTYNPLATDPDGDSLAYSLLPCNFPYPNPGFAYPSGTFSINPTSGQLTWCTPQIAGDYNVVIKIEEWRKNTDGDYVLVGSVNRDTQFTLSTCTGINETAAQKPSVTAFPNPASQQCELQFTGFENGLYVVSLHDITGRTIIEPIQKSISYNSSHVLDLQTVNPGIYFVTITGNNQSAIIKKIIKQ